MRVIVLGLILSVVVLLLVGVQAGGADPFLESHPAVNLQIEQPALDIVVVSNAVDGQFSRDYSRHFGASPSKDLKNLRNGLERPDTANPDAESGENIRDSATSPRSHGPSVTGSLRSIP